MNQRAVLTTTGLAAVLALTLAPAAQAGPEYQVDVGGQGTYSEAADGSVFVTATAAGAPFDGWYTAVLRADDGSLPDPEECEAGSATVRFDGSRGRYLELSSDVEICGVYLQTPHVITHQATGRYDVTSSSERRLRGDDGNLEILLATESRAIVSAIDT
jgi:hypothetical protein